MSDIFKCSKCGGWCDPDMLGSVEFEETTEVYTCVDCEEPQMKICTTCGLETPDYFWGTACASCVTKAVVALAREKQKVK